MSTHRFAFQQASVRQALAEDTGVCLNVGCLDDQASNPENSLKPLGPDRVINCDLSAVDELYDESGDKPIVIGSKPNAAEVLFDAARDRWPFDDGAACLVVLGDILEHLTPDDIRAALSEARRVSRRLCITTPEDRRETTSNERADLYRRGHVHRTVMTQTLLQGLLLDTGWTVTEWQTVEYDDGTFWGMRVMGHHVRAE